MRRSVLATLGTALLLGGSLTAASAQMGPPAAPSWHWPLYEAVDPGGGPSMGGFKVDPNDATRLVRGQPRPNVWGSHLGFEKYSSGVDLHPGIDIRGEGGDIVEIPSGGDVVYVENHAQCKDGLGDKCRLFIRTGSLLYYLGHFSFSQAPNGTQIRSNREIVQDGSYSGAPTRATSVQTGDQFGQIMAYIDPAGWDHLHISLFEPGEHYDNLDPLRYLTGPLGTPSNVISGDEGGALTIVDDERPFVGPLDLVPDTQVASSAGTVVDDPTCGTEVSGNIDIKAHIVDTFFTSRPVPHDFEGRDDWNNTIGISGARYFARHLGTGQVIQSQWYESPLGCSDYACGAWRAPFPQNHPESDYATLLAVTSDAGFVNDYLENSYPEFTAGDVADDLFDVGASDLDHSPPNGAFQYIHVLTNGAREDDTSGSDGYLQTDDLPDGAIAITVEAWDNAGNRSARTRTVNVRNTSAPKTGPNWSPIYSRDSDTDAGQIPSTLGGEPFWASPDITVVPASEPKPSPDSPPRATKVVVGEHYKVYVRAHNPGCTDATGASARVWIATPGTQLEDHRLLGEASGATIPLQGAEWIGGIDWTPTQEDLDGADEGHRCLVAQIGSANEPLPASSDPTTFHPPDSSKIVQRNVQTTDLKFWIKNVQQSTGKSQVRLELEGFSSGRMQLLIERTPEMEAGWDGLCSGFGAGSSVTCFHHEGWYVLEVHGDIGESPLWDMPGVTQLDATVLYELPDGARGTVTLTHYIDGAEVGGMVFTMSGATIIK